MNAQLSQIERRDTGPSFLDRTGDYVALLQDAETTLITKINDAIYRPDYGTIQLNGRRQWVSDALHDATDYASGPSTVEVIDSLVRIARSGNADARAMIDRLVQTWAKHNAEVAE